MGTLEYDPRYYGETIMKAGNLVKRTHDEIGSVGLVVGRARDKDGDWVIVKWTGTSRREVVNPKFLEIVS